MQLLARKQYNPDCSVTVRQAQQLYTTELAPILSAHNGLFSSLRSTLSDTFCINDTTIASLISLRDHIVSAVQNKVLSSPIIDAALVLSVPQQIENVLLPSLHSLTPETLSQTG